MQPTARELEKRGVELLDPRTSHLQLRCRRCGSTWRPRQSVERGLEPDFWRCWRGCNSALDPPSDGPPG